MRSLIAASLSLLCMTPAAADLDGHLLHRMCKQKNLEFVSGFVVGVTDKAAYDAEFVGALMAEKADLAKKTRSRSLGRGPQGDPHGAAVLHPSGRQARRDD
jgi:hypothetical protein